MVFSLDEIIQESDFQISFANSVLMDKSIAFTECIYEDASLYTEKSGQLMDAVKIFIANIAKTLQKFYNDIKSKIDVKLTEKSFKEKLEQIEGRLKERKEQGRLTERMVDFEKLAKTYSDMTDELSDLARKIAVGNYNSARKLNEDLDEFYAIADEYETELNKIMENEALFPINKALDFVDRELRHDGKVLKSITKSIALFEQMENQVKAVELQKDILGDELMTKKVSVIRKISTRFTKAVRKWSSKIITKAVFFFA